MITFLKICTILCNYYKIYPKFKNLYTIRQVIYCKTYVFNKFFFYIDSITKKFVF